MKNRKALRNIAYGILTSFISRNNDVYGYWGIGKLYFLMEKKSNYEITIDLQIKKMTPPEEEFKWMIQQYAEKFKKNLTNANLDLSQIKEAKIIINGFPNQAKFNPYLKSKIMGQHKMSCRFEVIDKEDKSCIVEMTTHCCKHNPKSESKSTRAYEK